ncbi:MAG: hypothetical protein U1E42_09415 [Rhodospirillales bacterium]
MSAAKVLRAARDAGIGLHADGEALVVEAFAPPPGAILELLSRHKADVIALLQGEADAWFAEDWLAFFEERAGIAEFDGGWPRGEAEVIAYACCVSEWLNRVPVCSPPGRCLGCGKDEQAHDPLLPFGTEVAGHVWLHGRCWSAWHTGRKQHAVAALAAMGIKERSVRP